MKSVSRILGVAGLALFGWATAAQAAPVAIDFTGNGGDLGPGLLFDLGGGAELEVIAVNYPGGSVGDDAPFGSGEKVSLYQGIEGLGVFVSPGDSVQLDGQGALEAMAFFFNQTVTLLSVTLDDGEMFDNFDMSMDDVDLDIVGLLGSDALLDLPEAAYGDDSRLADFEGDGLTGTVFTIYAADANDDFRVRELLVEVTDGGDTGDDVPAPSAMLLLGMGLAGLGLARRRRD